MPQPSFLVLKWWLKEEKQKKKVMSYGLYIFITSKQLKVKWLPLCKKEWQWLSNLQNYKDQKY